MSLLPFPPNNVTEAIQLINQDAEILHEVVHGDDTAQVLTDNGLIPSVNKTIKDIVDRMGVGTGADIALRSDLLNGDVNFKLYSTPPIATNSLGFAGQVSYDADFFYVCVADNSWKRVALTTW